MARLFTLIALLLVVLSLSSSPSPVFAQRAVEYYNENTQWTCPVTCDAASAWCRSIMLLSGGGGNLESVDCKIDPNSGTVLSFGCRCNDVSSAVVWFAQLGAETTTVTSTTTTTTSPTGGNFTFANATTTTTSTTTTQPTTTNSSSICKPGTGSNATCLSNLTSTTTTTTTTVTLPAPRTCSVAVGSRPYFTQSPGGLFCSALTTSCPNTCVKARAWMEGECRNGYVECTATSSYVDAFCRTCTSDSPTSYRVLWDPTNASTTAKTLPMQAVGDCRYKLAGATDTSLNLPSGTCGVDQCGRNGCCNNDRCSCFDGAPRGWYAGTLCESCRQLYGKENGLCVVEQSNILLLSFFFDNRPSGLFAPVLCLVSVLLLFFMLRARWNTDVERYVIPAGVPLVDPVSGYSVPPSSRFVIPPRPTASRGVVNQRVQERKAAMMNLQHQFPK